MDSETILVESATLPSSLEKYKDELREILHKSQDAFEKQLSYISAGCLVLSIGYVKDVVKNIEKAPFRFYLIAGWGFMVLTLLLNLISHLMAVSFYRLTISEIDTSIFNSISSMKRFRKITFLNWACVASLILGIVAILLFINLNL
jgi:hypothetical protein